MKKQKIAAVALAVSCIALVLSVASLCVSLRKSPSGTVSSDGSTGEAAPKQEVVEGSGADDSNGETFLDARLEADVTSLIDDGSWHVSVVEASYTGSVLEVALQITNNTSEASSNYISVGLDVYQQGVELEGTSVAGNPSGKVQPGSSVTVRKQYKLSNNTDDVLVELGYLSQDVVASETWKLS